MVDLTFFSPAARSADERQRQAVLDSYDILDKPADPVFGSLVEQAAKEMGTPIAAISLIDRDRQWFLASVGLDISETPRACSFCAHAMLRPQDILCVPDATLDQRFEGNPLVDLPGGIRFYAGAPLILNDGTAIGALCVIDAWPRSGLTVRQMQKLRTLARKAVERIELLKPPAAA